MIERIVRDIPTETFEPLDKSVEKLNYVLIRLDALSFKNHRD